MQGFIDHIRNNFVDGYTAQGASVTEETIKLLIDLCDIEKQASGEFPEARSTSLMAEPKPDL